MQSCTKFHPPRSFQIHAMMGDKDTLEAIVKHTLKHHFPNSSYDEDGIIEWARTVAKTTAEMIAHWMRVGFVHGVMNTDNMSIHGLTIDYGPMVGLRTMTQGGRQTRLMLAGEDTVTEHSRKLGLGILLDS